MKTIIVILVVLGLGWLVLHKTDKTIQTTTPNEHQEIPSGQTTTNTDPDGPDYQPNKQNTSSDASLSVPPIAVKTRVEKSFTITGSNFAFAPKQIAVKKGDTVKITFINNDGFHDLHIDEFNIATKQIKAGAQETTTFVADKTGSFQYYCSVGTHRAMGMWGTLTVTE